MFRLARLTAAVAGCVFVLSTPGLGALPQDSGIKWHTDKRKAFDEARRTGRPLWIVFR